MISKNMAKAINKQINAELYSSYLYTSMSAYCSHEGLTGVANWLFVQSREEATHAWRFYLYLLRVGERVLLDAIDKPPVDFESVQQIFEEVLKHEHKVTSMINDLANLAAQEKDHASANLLQWFVNEQVEEEENANDILAKMKLAGATPGGIFLIDKDLATRTFVMPADMPGGAAA